MTQPIKIHHLWQLLCDKHGWFWGLGQIQTLSGPRGALSPGRETSTPIKHHTAVGQLQQRSYFKNTMDKRERASESAGPGRGSCREAKKGFAKGRALI